MKTTVKTNWRIEIRPYGEAAKKECGKRIVWDIARDITMSANASKCYIEIKHDEEEICDECGRLWVSFPVYFEEFKRTLSCCLHCVTPEKDEL